MIRSALIALLLAGATAPAHAQAPASAGPVDPARLAAASALIDILLPPATREQMVTGMMMPMLANVRRSFADNPQFTAALDADPRVRALFDQFMAKQEMRSVEMMRQSLPGMMPAMAKAYARRFDLQQLSELRTFFETPTGRAYMQASFTIMSDPDIAAWQQEIMTRSMSGLQKDIAEMVKQAKALETKK